MSKHIDEALRALQLCDSKIQEANLILEHLEVWYGTQSKPSDSLACEQEYCDFYHSCRRRLKHKTD